MATISFIEAAYQILKREGRHLSAEEITTIALSENLIHTSGKTPAATMGARIYVDIRSKGDSSRFVKVDRGKFFLREAVKPKEREKQASLHDEIKQMLYEIGKLEGRISEKEYSIDGERIDVAWKRIERGNPYAVFEVQIGGNFYEALAKLKHAWDSWNSSPFLVTTKEYKERALVWVRGSFHEIETKLRIIDYDKVKDLYKAMKKIKSIKDELGIT